MKPAAFYSSSWAARGWRDFRLGDTLQACSVWLFSEPTQACALTTLLFPTAVSACLVLIRIWPLSRGCAPLPAHRVGLAMPVSAYGHPANTAGQGMQEEPRSPMTLVSAESVHLSVRQDGGYCVRR